MTTAVTRTVTTAVHRTIRRMTSSHPQIGPSSDSWALRITDLGAVAEIRLYDGATARLLGTYSTREDAYAAADEHSLALLAESGIHSRVAQSYEVNPPRFGLSRRRSRRESSHARSR